jgi:hypothetical protein
MMPGLFANVISTSAVSPGSAVAEDTAILASAEAKIAGAIQQTERITDSVNIIEMIFLFMAFSYFTYGRTA